MVVMKIVVYVKKTGALFEEAFRVVVTLATTETVLFVPDAKELIKKIVLTLNRKTCYFSRGKQTYI